MPQSENRVNKTDSLFRGSLKSSEVQPSENIWNNIERVVLLKERKKEKRRILFLRWAVAASIAMLFTLATYMWVTPAEKIRSKHEVVLRNKAMLSSPNAAPSLKTTKSSEHSSDKDNGSLSRRDSFGAGGEQLRDLAQSMHKSNKHNMADDKINKSIVESNTSSTVPTISINADYLARQQESEHKPSKSVEAKNDNVHSDIDKAMVTLNENTPELQAQSQGKPVTNTEINNNNLSARQDEPKIQVDSLPTQSTGLLADTASLEPFALNDPTKIENQTYSRWWIGAFYSPDYTYQNFSVASDNSNVVFSKKSNVTSMKNSYDKASHPKYSYTTGIQAGYQVNEKWSIQTGVLYADKGEITDYRLIDSSFFYSANSYTAVSPKGKNRIVNYKYQYFDVPLLIKYHMGRARLSYFVSAGLSANFFFRHQVVTESIDTGEKQTTTENPAPFKSINYSVIASVGIDYYPSAYSKRISVSLEPTFRHAFTSTVKNSAIDSYPYSLGLMTGVKYHF